jgi:hypothetical protein
MAKLTTPPPKRYVEYENVFYLQEITADFFYYSYAKKSQNMAFAWLFPGLILA